MTEYLLSGMILGGVIMGLIGFMIGDILGPTPRLTTQQTIDHIRQAEQDCLVKEYYYMDKHRTFCDMIGARP